MLSGLGEFKPMWTQIKSDACTWQASLDTSIAATVKLTGDHRLTDD